jgi:hypothetical protein
VPWASAEPGSGGLDELLATRSVSEWTEITVDTTRDVGQYLDVAVVPGTGIPYVSYYEGTAKDLWLATFVGSGGNCGPGSSWSCQVIDSTGDVGSHNSIAVRQATGTTVQVLIAYHDASNAALKYALGNCVGVGCALTTYTIQSGSLGLVTRGRYTSAAFSSGGWPYIAYQSATTVNTESVRVASRNLAGTGNCGVGDVAGDWQCDSILSGEGIGTATDIVIDGLGRPQIAFYDPNTGYPYHAIKIGSGGNCGPTNDWLCRSAFINTHDCGHSISVLAEADGTPHLAFVDQTSNDLVYASYVNSGGNCGFSSSSLQFEWQCDVIDDNIGPVGTSGRIVALAADATGAPMITYRDASDDLAPSQLRFAVPYYAAPAGAVPNCGPEDLFYTWVCVSMDGGGSYLDEGAAVAIASTSAGTSIAYHELDTYAYPAEGNLKLIMQLAPFFADGFETGNMNGWSSHVP